MHSKSLVLFKLIIIISALAKDVVLFAQDTIPYPESSSEVAFYRDYTEHLIRLEESKNAQLSVLFLISLAIISFLVYRLYVYRRISLNYQMQSASDCTLTEGVLHSTLEDQLANKMQFTTPVTNVEVAEASSSLSNISTLDAPSPSKEEKPAQSCDPKILELAARFERLMQEEHLFCESFLTRDRVAALLKTNRTYIGLVMSEVFHESFSQYVNNLRINEAITILQNPASRRPIRLIGRDLGFNSVTTFNTQFQKRTGMTPAQFRQQIIDAL